MSVGFRSNAAVLPANSTGGATIWDGTGSDSKIGDPMRLVRYLFSKPKERSLTAQLIVIALSNLDGNKNRTVEQHVAHYVLAGPAQQ